MRAEISICGTDCSACACLGSMCSGCNACEGKVFHAPEGKACPIYACVREEKQLHDCGACDKVPCDIWLGTRDPKYSDEEFEQNVNGRVQALRAQSGNGR